MATPSPLRLQPEWDGRFTRMLWLSAGLHLAVLVVATLVAPLARPRSIPMVAYTVEVTDPNALGGRLPPGTISKDLSGGPTRPVTPEPKGEGGAVEPPAPPEPPAPEPPKAVKAEPPAPIVPKPEPKKVELPKPAPKPEPAKVEPARPDAVKPTAAAKKVEGAAKAAERTPEKVTTPPTDASKKPGSLNGDERAPTHDAYSAAAERWRQRAAGGGLGGSETGTGPIGAGGEGKGGGGQQVGIEFLAYRQTVVNTIKGNWANVVVRPGLVVKVRFQIDAQGQVSDVHIEQASGNVAYDASAVRAVQRANPLPAPPARYANDFHEFVIEFHSEETGGLGAG